MTKMSNIFDKKEKEKLAIGIIEELKDVHHLEADEVRKVLSFGYGLISKEVKQQESEENGN